MSIQDDMREKITNKIVAALESGTSPWRKPWVGGGMPINLVSKKAYRGINTILLSLHQMAHNLSSNVYATYKQWKDVGCQVKARPKDLEGEFGAGIIFFAPVKGTKMQANGEEKTFSFPIMRSYTVFNADQVEGASEYLAKRVKAEPKTPAELHEDAERVIAAYLAAESLKVKPSNHAAYSPSEDVVMMPDREAFTMGTNSYYGTMMHELVHSTGHENRLNRLTKFSRFGSQAYALEELVAEIGGCYMLGSVGLPVLDALENHANYLANWLSVLKADSKAIFQASAAAAAAADRILKPSGILEDAEVEEPALS